MKAYWRILLVFFSILTAGWLSLQLLLYERLGLAGVLLPGLLFGAPFGLVNFEGWRQKARGALLNSLFAALAITGAFLLVFTLGPEGTGLAGMQFGLLLGFSCAALLTSMIFAVYGLSWPSALLAVGLGAILPALLGFEDAETAKVEPQLLAYFWLAVMGAVYTWGLRNKL